MQQATGTCYEDAWRFLIKEDEGELVHGSVQTIGKRIKHAWVELPTGWVWEPESGEFMKKDYFYERALPDIENRYNVEEAAIMVARAKNLGPWTEEEREQFIMREEGGNPMKTDEERISLHERIFGKGSNPPEERLGRGEALNNLLPMPPDEGPPLPRFLNLKWPGKK